MVAPLPLKNVPTRRSNSAWHHACQFFSQISWVDAVQAPHPISTPIAASLLAASNLSKLHLSTFSCLLMMHPHPQPVLRLLQPLAFQLNKRWLSTIYGIFWTVMRCWMTPIMVGHLCCSASSTHCAPKRPNSWSDAACISSLHQERHSTYAN